MALITCIQHISKTTFHLDFSQILNDRFESDLFEIQNINARINLYGIYSITPIIMISSLNERRSGVITVAVHGIYYKKFSHLFNHKKSIRAQNFAEKFG